MQQPATPSYTPEPLVLKSSAFNHNESIPIKYTCDGDNVNPPLTVENIDRRANSLVLIMDDPDAPSGVFDHWLKWNIPKSTTVISEGTEPEGISGKNSAGGLTYRGPCPPSGTHHYRFKLYSLDNTVTLGEGATKSQLEAAMQDHILQQTELVGLYSRNRQ